MRKVALLNRSGAHGLANCRLVDHERACRPSLLTANGCAERFHLVLSGEPRPKLGPHSDGSSVQAYQNGQRDPSWNHKPVRLPRNCAPNEVWHSPMPRQLRA
jgi:hypothetical protein